MKVLVTGCAGFIGFHLCKALLKRKLKVIGIDNLNGYYDINLKKNRLKELKKISKTKQFEFKKFSLENSRPIEKLFLREKFDIVVNLAAQAGVRDSFRQPKKYFLSNVVGFYNILEACRINKVKKLIFASTSSIYGDKKHLPFKENMSVEPIQFYASTKHTNEIMSKVYARNFKMNIIGIRFFTVYGPWGRPDMAIFKFVKNIFENKSISLFNNGDHSRDFTYIDDIVDGIKKTIDIKKKKTSFEIINLGSGTEVHLSKILGLIEKETKLKFKINKKGLQLGDIKSTRSSISRAKRNFKYRPKVNIQKGIQNFIKWYTKYFSIKS